MKKPVCRPVSVNDALTGQRLRIASEVAEPEPLKRGQNRVIPLSAGAQLCTPIRGAWHRADGMTLYVDGPTPLALRTAVEEGRTAEEVWFGAQPAGISEVEVEHSRSEVTLLLAA